MDSMQKVLVWLPVSILITIYMISVRTLVWDRDGKKGEKCCWLPQVRVPSDAKN